MAGAHGVAEFLWLTLESRGCLLGLATTRIEVDSSGSGAPNCGLYGSNQQYTVDVWHTPFTFHELVIQSASPTSFASTTGRGP
jgi:hypothetical protein